MKKCDDVEGSTPQPSFLLAREVTPSQNKTKEKRETKKIEVIEKTTPHCHRKRICLARETKEHSQKQQQQQQEKKNCSRSLHDKSEVVRHPPLPRKVELVRVASH